MTLSDISIRNPVFAWMLMLGLIFFGVICWLRMGLAQMPDVAFPVVNVTITLPNAAPEVVESDIADPVEQAVMGVEGVQDVQSTCSEGQASISVYLDLSRNPDTAVQEVQTQIFSVEKQLPTNIYPPVIKKYNPNNSPIIWFAVTADPPLTLRDLNLYTRDHIADRFTSLDGVSQVFLGGYMNREINVWVDNEKMNARQLTALDIINTIQTQHAEVPAGYMETPDQQYSIRMMGEAYTVPDFANLPILARGGSPNYTLTRLKDIASIEDGITTPIVRLSRFNSTSAIGLGVVMQDGYNAVDIASAAKKRAAELISQLPKGYHIAVNFDTTTFIKDNVHELELTIILAAILTSLVCFVFLGSWSSTLNVFLAIPTSLFGTFIVAYFFGFTLNTFTLLALSLSIGVVVDDAIMVLENIVRHQEKGEGQVEAALNGAREVTFAATATSLAIVAIFLPIAFMTGVIGKFFFQFGVTISGAVLISLLEAITLTPMRCAEFVHKADENSTFNHFVNAQFKKLSDAYIRILGVCLRWKTEVLLTQFKSGKISPFYRFFSWLFLIDRKKLVLEVQNELKKPLYSKTAVLYIGLGLILLLALSKWSGSLGHDIFLGVSVLFLLGFFRILWNKRHFLYSHLFFDHRWWVAIIALAIFAASLSTIKMIKQEFVPDTDMSVFIINLNLPVQYSVEKTDGVVKICETMLHSRGEVKNVYAAVGGFGGTTSNVGNIFLTMKNPGDRPIVKPSEKDPALGPWAWAINIYRYIFPQRLTQDEFANWVRKNLKKASPDLRVSVQDLSQRGWSTGKGYAVELIVTGPDWNVLTDCVQKIRAAIRSNPKLTDEYDNFLDGQPEIQVIPNRVQAALEGVSMADLGNVIASTIGGYQFQGTYFHQDGHDNPIAIRVPVDDRKGPDAINHIYVRNNRGEVLPISDVAVLKQVSSLQQITRDMRQRAVIFYANAGRGHSQKEALDEALQVCKSILPEGYNVQLTGSSQANSDSLQQLGLVMALGIVVAYMVLGSQFNSFIHPIIILLALPFSVTGAFFSLLVTGQALSIYSMVGIILLMGLVKKNSIMLVDFTNQRRAAGMNVHEALMNACPIRLRPILMTTFATVAGAIPAALALGPGAELRQPMSIAIIGGMIFSTVLTLLVVPCAYSVMSGLENRKAHHSTGYEKHSKEAKVKK